MCCARRCNDHIPVDWLMTASRSGQVRFILVGLGLMLLMIFRPQGIFGDRGRSPSMPALTR